MGYTIQLDKDGDYCWDEDPTHHDPYMQANTTSHTAVSRAAMAAPHVAAHHAFHEPFIKLNLTDKNIFNGLGFILIVIFIYLLLITLQQMLTRHIYNTVQHCVKAHLDSKNLQ
uniref:Uncharacterized protein B117L n=1 Tax=African swine fever virus (isolate Warthog/Namibia/Wart80/1980) TaxID=561444 RepID=VF117_ASFWA|nr:RecName: Full=Uncharacterized protein B117L; Short=pB117L [African swine fever virus warthog/Namibia/Wart80/1980]